MVSSSEIQFLTTKHSPKILDEKKISWDVEHSVCRTQVVFATHSLVTLPSPTTPDGQGFITPVFK